MKQSIECRAGQTVEEMAQQLRSAPVPTHWKSSNPDNSLSSVIQSNLSAFDRRERVRLDDVESVREHCKNYLMACEQAGRCPSFAGLAASMGWSRKGVYEYISKHDTESSRLLQVFQTVIADCLMQAGLTNSVNAIMSIFLLKNSGQGLSDRSELEISTTVSSDPLASGVDAETVRQRYITALPDITDEE